MNRIVASGGGRQFVIGGARMGKRDICGAKGGGALFDLGGGTHGALSGFGAEIVMS